MATLTWGTHCKACNALLPVTHHDPELCTSCLKVVSTLNGDIYYEQETVADLLNARGQISLSVEVE